MTADDPFFRWGHMVPQDNLPEYFALRQYAPRQSVPETNRPGRQYALRICALETNHLGHNLPLDNMHPRKCAPETTHPGDNMPREKTRLVLLYVILG